MPRGCASIGEAPLGRDPVSTDGGSFDVGESGCHLLDHRVLALSVVIDVGCGGTDALLDRPICQRGCVLILAATRTDVAKKGRTQRQ